MDIKRRTALFALGMILLVAATPALVSAHPGNENQPCAALPDEAEVSVTSPADPIVTVYADLETAAGYQESNGVEGLQTHAHACRVGSGNDATTTTVQPDTKLTP